MKNNLHDISASCKIKICRDGKWYYEGLEIVHPAILKSFFEMLEVDEQGRYRIRSDKEICYIEVEDTPFVVSAIRTDQQGDIKLVLNNLKSFDLNPAKLFAGKNNILYTTLPDGITVRFSRSAYYTFALMLEEDDKGSLSLSMGGRTYDMDHLIK